MYLYIREHSAFSLLSYAFALDRRTSPSAVVMLARQLQHKYNIIYNVYMYIAWNGMRSNLLAHYRRQDIFHIYNHNNNNNYYYYCHRRRRHRYIIIIHDYWRLIPESNARISERSSPSDIYINTCGRNDDPIVQQQPSAFYTYVLSAHITIYYYYHNGPSDKNNCVQMHNNNNMYKLD